jgi:hypothetical protein
MKILLILLLPTMALATSEIQDAKRSIQSLIRPLLAGSSKKVTKSDQEFRIDGCDQKKIDWMGVILMRETATLNYKFKKYCDIEGTITPKVFQSFPVKLKLRNIKSYSQVESQNKITANLEQKPILNLEMEEGLLSGKDAKVKFTATYKVQINPVADDTIEKNLGGELRIIEINGKKTNIKEKIYIE